MDNCPHRADALVRHVVATLPDSMIERRRVLVSTLAVLPRDYPHRDWVSTLIHDLQVSERDQLKFLEIISSAGAGTIKGKEEGR